MDAASGPARLPAHRRGGILLTIEPCAPSGQPAEALLHRPPATPIPGGGTGACCGGSSACTPAKPPASPEACCHRALSWHASAPPYSILAMANCVALPSTACDSALMSLGSAVLTAIWHKMYCAAPVRCEWRGRMQVAQRACTCVRRMGCASGVHSAQAGQQHVAACSHTHAAHNGVRRAVCQVICGEASVCDLWCMHGMQRNGRERERRWWGVPCSCRAVHAARTPGCTRLHSPPLK